ncbi:hypothetical protein K443DRAFT_12960 [Laccaria amethystina LaAM-08-1]|uniref:SH3 domain-containing protein n=1 Tax=Laccaria amethystina LaAM-08-1 TaxID=1095629 RepID=A0A0C9WIP7_9AGAR|nr:hypothetical protein K443DRAFT_12960 [Laccaria amethystina LaAM-08-1]
MEAAELARWTRFAAKGGIGKCIVTADCVAESSDDLMFLMDDEITVLLQFADQEDAYLGYCEGVVDRFQGHDVYFQSKLKKPIMTKGASVSASSNESPTPGLKSLSDSPLSTASKSDLGLVARSQRLTPASALESPVLSTGLKSPPTPHLDVTLHPTLSLLAPGDHPLILDRKPSFNPQASSTTDEENQLNSGMSFSSSSTASDSALNTPATPILTVSSPTKKIPVPLNLPDANIPPLRITKRSPLSPPSSPPANKPAYQSLSPHSSPPASQPPHQPLSPLSSSTFPDCSYSMLREESDRVSLALSDGEVGIGLSLLQDLANELRAGNGDDDEEDKWSRSSGSSSVELRRHQQSKSDSEDGTIEELNYARDNDDSDSDDDQEAHNQVVSSFPAPPTFLRLDFAKQMIHGPRM